MPGLREMGRTVVPSAPRSDGVEDLEVLLHRRLVRENGHVVVVEASHQHGLLLGPFGNLAHQLDHGVVAGGHEEVASPVVAEEE